MLVDKESLGFGLLVALKKEMKTSLEALGNCDENFIDKMFNLIMKMIVTAPVLYVKTLEVP